MLRGTTATKKTLSTTAATTLPAELLLKIPSSLPGGESFDVHTRIGLDSADSCFSLEGESFTGVSFAGEHAVYGGALSFACNPDTGRAEVKINLKDNLHVHGIKGVMWYVDFSRVSPDPKNEGPCASISLADNVFRSNNGGFPGDYAIGYYYLGGEWNVTCNVNFCRMQLPEGFCGWVYVPLTSYNRLKAGTSTELYDAETGVGVEGLYVSVLRLHTDGYEYSDQKSITFDEIIFVK